MDTDKIVLLRGMEPDYEKGGKIIDGVMIGPKVSTCRWRIGHETRLFDNRPEAEKELKLRQFNLAISHALGVVCDRTSLTPREMIHSIRIHARELGNVLKDRKFSNII